MTCTKTNRKQRQVYMWSRLQRPPLPVATRLLVYIQPCSVLWQSSATYHAMLHLHCSSASRINFLMISMATCGALLNLESLNSLIRGWIHQRCILWFKGGSGNQIVSVDEDFILGEQTPTRERSPWHAICKWRHSFSGDFWRVECDTAGLILRGSACLIVILRAFQQ